MVTFIGCEFAGLPQTAVIGTDPDGLDPIASEIGRPLPGLLDPRPVMVIGSSDFARRKRADGGCDSAKRRTIAGSTVARASVGPGTTSSAGRGGAAAAR